MTEMYLLGAASGAALLTWLLFSMTDGMEP
jgi:hypothetical protein